jgi:hypothetical protein
MVFIINNNHLLNKQNNMRVLNIEEKTKNLNEFRLQNANKSFTYSELKEKLGQVLSKNNLVLASALKIFPFDMIGKSRLYSMPKEPIHISFVKAIYNKQSKMMKEYRSKTNEPNKEVQSEESALKLLQSKGYQIRRVIGFDMERFQKENPALYKKYLRYEII